MGWKPRWIVALAALAMCASVGLDVVVAPRSASALIGLNPDLGTSLAADTGQCMPNKQLFDEDINTNSTTSAVVWGARAHLFFNNRALDTTCAGTSKAVSTVHMAAPLTTGGGTHYVEFGYITQRNNTTGTTQTLIFTGASDGAGYSYYTTGTGRLVNGMDDRYQILITANTDGTYTYSFNILFHDGTSVNYPSVTVPFHASWIESETEAFGPNTGFTQQFRHLQRNATPGTATWVDWGGVRCSTVSGSGYVYSQLGTPRWNPFSASGYDSTMKGTNVC